MSWRVFIVKTEPFICHNNDSQTVLLIHERERAKETDVFSVLKVPCQVLGTFFPGSVYKIWFPNGCTVPHKGKDQCSDRIAGKKIAWAKETSGEYHNTGKAPRTQLTLFNHKTTTCNCLLIHLSEYLLGVIEKYCLNILMKYDVLA